MNSFTVGVFSCERIAAHFPPLWRTILLRRRQRKVRLSEGRPILVTFHLFLVLVGGTNIFSELISSLKIAKLCFETTAAHATIIKRTQLSFLPLREPKRKENTSLHCTRKQRLRLLPLFSREINHRMYQIYKEDGVVNRFLTALRHF